MGKLTFTPLQKSLFETITQHSFLPKSFYFTGGTALSAVYLHHRESEDLDFFSETDFENEPILEIIKNIALSLKITYRFTIRHHSRIIELVQKDKLLIKIEDFDFLPKMITPLTLKELKSFFREKAKELGKKSIE